MFQTRARSGLRAELLDENTIKQIDFPLDDLSITNILSLVFQSNCKDFGAVPRPLLQLTKEILWNMKLMLLQKRKLVDNDVGEEERAGSFHKWILEPFIGILLSGKLLLFLLKYRWNRTSEGSLVFRFRRASKRKRNSSIIRSGKSSKIACPYVHPEQRRFQGPSTFAEAIYSLFLEFGGFKQHVKNQQ